MHTDTVVRTRATIVKLPDSSPGLLVASGRQLAFTLDRVWRSAIAPAVNMTVEVEYDPAYNLIGIWAVDAQQLARESLDQFSVAAQRHGREAAGAATQGLGTLAARMGKGTLAAVVVLWIAWFWLPAVNFRTPMFTKAFTFWELLGIDFQSMSMQSHGLFSLLGVAALLAPFAVGFRPSRAGVLNSAPAIYLLLSVFEIRSRTEEAVGSIRQFGGHDLFSLSVGAYVLLMAAVVLAVLGLRGQSRERGHSPAGIR